jgi:hypothetical protein
MENRLCLGVLVGRQRFRTPRQLNIGQFVNPMLRHRRQLRNFGIQLRLASASTATLPAYPASAGYGAGHLQVWRRTCTVTQEQKRQHNLEARRASKGGRHPVRTRNSAQDDLCAHGTRCPCERISAFSALSQGSSINLSSADFIAVPAVLRKLNFFTGLAR